MHVCVWSINQSVRVAVAHMSTLNPGFARYFNATRNAGAFSHVLITHSRNRCRSLHLFTPQRLGIA